MHCGSSNVRWVSASGRGVIYSYTVIHQNKSPEFVQDTPYNVVVVQLAEGPRLMSTIVETGLAELRIDMPVTVVFDAVSEVIHLPRFKAL
jgi:uncharacterized OB-fold protein